MSCLTVQKLLPSAQPTFERFSIFVLNNLEHVNPRFFAKEFGIVQKHSISQIGRDTFCAEADILADKLTQAQSFDLAGIIISNLCKLTEYIPAKLEHFAIKGYEIAKINGDYIHMLTRLNSLRQIYFRRPEKLYNYIQVLYKQEKCLKELTNHYETATATFKSVTRKPASKKEYEQMLAHVQTEIGKLTKKKHPHDARAKLLSAREIFARQGNTQHLSYIDMLLSEIEQIILRKSS